MAGIRLKEDLFGGVFDGGKDQVLLSREKRQEMVDQLQEMLGEAPDLIRAEAVLAEDLAEDTPYGKESEPVDFVAEEEDPAAKPEGDLSGAAPSGEASETVAADEPPQSAAKMEEVLNQGMGFISGLLEMALGQKLTTAEGSEKLVTLDRETGEVTLKFTLPGFGRKG